MKIVEHDKCCGCWACYNACNFEAIAMKEDDLGYFYPQINGSNCKECGKCKSVCPALNNIKDIPDLAIYAGHINDDKELEKSASGGVMSAFGKWFINNRGYVVGCTYDRGYYNCKHAIARNYDMLDKLKGTKYTQSNKGSIYGEVKKLLKDNELVLFTGLPCEVVALKQFLGKKYENLYTCDLICHGPVSGKAQEEFIKKYEEKYKSPCVYFNPKDKTTGWDHPKLKMRFANGKEITKLFYRTALGDAFENMPRNSCKNCLFKGKKRASDITCGDFWGCKDEKMGVSVMVVHSEKGLRLIKEIDNFSLKEADYSQMVKNNKHYEASCNIRPSKLGFAEVFAEKGVFEASKKTTTFLRKIYLYIKSIEEFFVHQYYEWKK